MRGQRGPIGLEAEMVQSRGRNISQQLVAACSLVPGDQLALEGGRLVSVCDVWMSSIDRSVNLQVRDIEGRAWVIGTSEPVTFWVVTVDARD